jgi:UDP-N-acetylglucosamine--N-acetylmuramyl-(pentapeptide) pyrophosphoryl-undecaprenol N-acetylglucosamine transferase
MLFRERLPQAVLAMGGFTCAPPVLAGKACGAATFLHESNTVPGKANRWLARVVNQAFVGFPVAASRLRSKSVETTGTPVRAQFQPGQAAACRAALGLAPDLPVLLVMGGSQGASGINDLVIQALPRIVERAPRTQFLHLTGPDDLEKIDQAYRQRGCKAVVRAFLNEMEWALGAATVAVSRAGGSSLAELAAMRVPAMLIPYPFAADNHQYHNARLLVDRGAALLLEQSTATPEALAGQILQLVLDESAHSAMSQAMGSCHTPQAAGRIADKMLAVIRAMGLWRLDDADVAAGQASLRTPHSALA